MSATIKALNIFATKLRNMGETQGADALERRAKELESPVELIYSDKRISVKTPLMANKRRFYAMVSQLKAIDSREWDKEAEVNTFDKKDETKVLAVLQNFYAGHNLVTEDGTTVIPSAS